MVSSGRVQATTYTARVPRRAGYRYKGLHWDLNLLNQLRSEIQQQKGKMACAAEGKEGGVWAGVSDGRKGGSLAVFPPGESHAAGTMQICAANKCGRPKKV